jgi:hypothetical protein
MTHIDYRHTEEYAKMQEAYANAETNNEPVTQPLTSEEDEQLTYEKRLEEAEDRDRDIAEGWNPY